MENQQNKEVDNLLRVKELLFGEDLQEVNKQFEALKKDLEKSLKEFEAGLENTISDLKAKQEKNAFMIQEVNQKKLKEISSEFNEQISSLKTSLENQNVANDEKLDELKNAQVSKKEMIAFLQEIIEKLK